MKKKLFVILGITVGVLAVVLAAFVGTSKRRHSGADPSQSLGNSSVQETVGLTDPTMPLELSVAEIYRNLLLDESYKKDGEYGFDNDCYFLLWDADEDGEKELLVTGPTGVDSLYASILYDYENNVLSFTTLHGDPVAVAIGAVEIDGWYAEGEEAQTIVYRVKPGAELADNMLFSDNKEFDWALTLYADYDYGDLDLEGIPVAYLFPTDAESIVEHCK